MHRRSLQDTKVHAGYKRKVRFLTKNPRLAGLACFSASSSLNRASKYRDDSDDPIHRDCS